MTDDTTKTPMDTDSDDPGFHAPSDATEASHPGLATGPLADTETEPAGTRPATDAEGYIVETEAQAYETPAPAPGDNPWERPDHEWYKDAVFYEVLVRAFYDPDGNGVEDSTCTGSKRNNAFYGAGIVDAYDAVRR